MSALSEAVNEAVGELARLHDEMKIAAEEGRENSPSQTVYDVKVDVNKLEEWQETCGQLSDRLEGAWES